MITEKSPSLHGSFLMVYLRRLAPLPGAENNNKPGVKLPSSLEIDGVQVPLTILEAVLKQTGVYAGNRKGRLSVFWGDQVGTTHPRCPTHLLPLSPSSYLFAERESHHLSNDAHALNLSCFTMQVFIPTAPVEYIPTHHIDILCSLGPMPSAEEWVAKGLEKYGLIAVNESNEAAQVNHKATHNLTCLSFLLYITNRPQSRLLPVLTQPTPFC